MQVQVQLTGQAHEVDRVLGYLRTVVDVDLANATRSEPDQVGRVVACVVVDERRTTP